MMTKQVCGLALAGLLSVVTLAGHAAGLSVNASGVLVPFSPADGSSYMEVWGVGSNSRYANPATDPGDLFHDLIAVPEIASQSLLSGYAFSTAAWTFDPAAAPVSVGASGNSARYAMSALGVGLSGGGNVALSSADTQLLVSRSTNHHTQLLRFGYVLPTVDGPLAGSTFSFGVTGGTTTGVDLVSLLGPSAYTVSGFDLSAFASLPVRLTAPSVMRPVFLGVDLFRSNPSADFGITPQATLSLADFDSATISVAFDGVYGVSVDAADFASNDAYLAARDWVQANVRQVNYEVYASWQIGALQTTPVPETGTLALSLLGLPALALLRRRR